MIPKDLLERHCLGFIPQLRAGAVSVDVVDRIGSKFRVLQGSGHRPGCPDAVFVRLGNVPGVAAGTKPNRSFGVIAV